MFLGKGVLEICSNFTGEHLRRSVISMKLPSLICNYLNHVDSQYIKKSKQVWHCFNLCKNVFLFTLINNYKLYHILSEKHHCDDQNFSNWNQQRIHLTYLMNSTTIYEALLRSQKILSIPNSIILINYKALN